MAFDISVTYFGPQASIILKEVTSGTYAEVYSFGALLNSFTSQHHGAAINVIDGFKSPAEASENITQFFKSAKLSPFACRVKNSKYRFTGKDYMLGKFALRGTAIHGLLFNVPFEITAKACTDAGASVVLMYKYDNTTEGFPFKFKIEVEYTLATNNALTVKTTVTNVDDQLLPVVDGWHPYFTLGDSINNYQIEFQSKEMLEFDEELVPTGKLVPFQQYTSLKALGVAELDNCFTLNFAECQPMCVIRHPTKKVQIEFYPDSSYPYLQIYTPEHRKSIAIENLSGAPDAFNNGMGLKVLAPGELAIFTTKFITTSL